MNDASMLFAILSWQQTILRGSCSDSDSRGISKTKLSDRPASPNRGGVKDRRRNNSVFFP